jgi:alkylation response protein AidB-like acyl-CoA dehydrogenase
MTVESIRGTEEGVLTAGPTTASPSTAGAALAPADTSEAALGRLTSALAANAERYDRTGEFPRDSIQAVHDAGILTLGIGPKYGGHDLSLTEAARVMQALGRGDPSVALLTAMTLFQHLAQAKAPRWPDALYRKVVRDSQDRPVLMNAIRAEPEWGAPARGGLPATKVSRTAGGWRLNGHKNYGTGSEGLAYHLVWAVTDEAATGNGEPLVGHLIVPGDSSGIEVIRTWDHLGLRAEEVLYGLAGRIDAGDEQALARAAIAKLLITRSAVTAVQTAVTALGNPGLTRHNPLERHFRDIQCCRIHPPQDDAALIGVGRRTLSRPAANHRGG